MDLLEVKNLKACYGQIEALKGISFKVKENTIVSFIGPNGAGKSTLAKTISGLHDAWSGEIIFAGSPISGLPPWEIVKRGLVHCPERRHIFPFMSVKDNLLMGAYSNRVHVKKNLEFVFKLFPRLRERQNQQAKTLSGGEAQMLAIGRSLMASPKLLILDEPFLGLAPSVRESIINALKELKEEGVSLLIMEQEMYAAARISDENFLIGNGKILMSGDSSEFLKNPYIRDIYFYAR